MAWAWAVTQLLLYHLEVVFSRYLEVVGTYLGSPGVTDGTIDSSRVGMKADELALLRSVAELLGQETSTTASTAELHETRALLVLATAERSESEGSDASPGSEASATSDMRRRAARTRPPSSSVDMLGATARVRTTRTRHIFIVTAAACVFLILPIAFGAAGFALSAVLFEAKRESRTFRAEARVLTARHASPWLPTLLSIDRREGRDGAVEQVVGLRFPTLAPTPLPTSLGAPPLARLVKVAPPGDLWIRDAERALARARTSRGT